MKFACDEVDDAGKVAVGAITSGLGGLDEAVNAFEDTVVDLGGEPAEDSVLMTPDSNCSVDDRLDAAVGGPEVPVVEVSLGLIRRLVIEVLEGEANLVGLAPFSGGSG